MNQQESMEQNSNRALDEEASEYVLGTLEGTARDDFQQRMREDPLVTEAVIQWEKRLSPMMDRVHEVTPPDTVWREIEQRLGFVVERQSDRFWNSLRFWRGATVLATTFGLALALILFSQLPVTSEMLYVVQDQQRTEWVVRANHRQSQVAIRAVNPPQLDQGKVCQLWITTPDGVIHSLGQLPHDGTVTLPITGERRQLLSQEAELLVTIETEGAMIQPQPQGPIVSKGRWIQI